jgi:hypothetical protein
MTDQVTLHIRVDVHLRSRWNRACAVVHPPSVADSMGERHVRQPGSRGEAEWRRMAHLPRGGHYAGRAAKHLEILLLSGRVACLASASLASHKNLAIADRAAQAPLGSRMASRTHQTDASLSIFAGVGPETMRAICSPHSTSLRDSRNLTFSSRRTEQMTDLCIGRIATGKSAPAGRQVIE